jgi:hypothetical protein
MSRRPSGGKSTGGRLWALPLSRNQFTEAPDGGGGAGRRRPVCKHRVRLLPARLYSHLGACPRIRMRASKPGPLRFQACATSSQRGKSACPRTYLPTETPPPHTLPGMRN